MDIFIFLHRGYRVKREWGWVVGRGEGLGFLKGYHDFDREVEIFDREVFKKSPSKMIKVVMVLIYGKFKGADDRKKFP